MRCSTCGRRVPDGRERCYACEVDAPTAIEKEPRRHGDSTVDDIQTVLSRAAEDPADQTVDEVSTLQRRIKIGPAPFVGRDDERERILGAWRAVARGGTLRLLLVRGPEGIGKTRLVEHCLRRMERGERSPAAVLRGRPPEVDAGRGSAFEAMIRDRLDVPLELAPEEGRRRLLEAVRERVPGPAAFDVASLLGRLLHLPFPGSAALKLEGDALERRLGRAISNLLGAEAAAGPVIIWIDAIDRLGPQDRLLMRRIVGALQRERVLMVASGRDPGDAIPPGVDLVAVDLGPLDEPSSRRIVTSLLSKCPDVPETLLGRVAERSQGNPRALEGAVHVLIGQGVVDTQSGVWSVDRDRLDAGELPEGPEDVLRARISGLAREDRRLLEAGAVQGREFRLPAALACLMADERPADDFWVEDPRRRRVEAALERLVGAELVDAGESDTETWRMIDDRTADLAREGIDPERLGRWRRVLAVWLENRGDRAGVEAAAEFWEAGGRPARAAKGHKAAGDRAAEEFRSDEAIRSYTRALELLDDADFQQCMELRSELGNVRDAIGDHKGAIKEFEAMLRDSAVATDAGVAALALRRIGEVRGAAGDWDQARLCLGRARALYEAVGDLIGVATALEALGQVELYRGSPRSMTDAQANVELALRLRQEAGDGVGVAQSYHYLGWIHADSGRDADAQGAYQAAIRIRRDSGDRAGLVRSLNNLGDIHVAFGRHAEGMEVLLEALFECESIGLAAVRPTILVNLARTRLDTGDLAEAADWIEQAEQALEGVDDRLTRVEIHLLNSRLLQALGEQRQAVEQAQAAGRIVEAMEGSYQQGVVMRRLAELHSATLYDPSGGQEATAKANELFERSVAVLEGSGHELELAHTLDAYARFCKERGRAEEATRMTRRAAELRG